MSHLKWGNKAQVDVLRAGNQHSAEGKTMALQQGAQSAITHWGFNRGLL